MGAGRKDHVAVTVTEPSRSDAVSVEEGLEGLSESPSGLLAGSVKERDRRSFLRGRSVVSMLTQDGLAPEDIRAGGLALDAGLGLDLKYELGDPSPVVVVREVGPARELGEIEGLGRASLLGIDLAAALAVEIGAIHPGADQGPAA